MAQGRHKNRVGVAGMNPYFADVPGIIQADVLPCAAGIGGLIHAVAMRDVDADGRFARAGIDHIWVGFGNGQRPD